MGETLLLFQLSRLDLYALTELGGFSNSVTLRAALKSKRHLSLLTYVPAGGDYLDAENFALSALFIYNDTVTSLEQNERERKKKEKKHNLKWRTMRRGK